MGNISARNGLFQRVAVFGGASGIGLATAGLASEAGGAVTILDVDQRAESLSIVASGRCEFIPCDVMNPHEVRATLAQIADRPGGLDAVVATVGGANVRTEIALDLEYWTRDIHFNLTSAYIVAATASEIMMSAGHGSIVTLSSSYGQSPGPDRIAYAAAKAGVIAMTRSLASATAAAGLRVNCVAPGATDKPRLRQMTGSPERFAEICKSKPQGRIATPDEVARVILFLLSDASRSMTGQVLHVNNGSYMP